MNQLDPSLTREGWTAEEDAVLVSQQKAQGHAWARMMALLPGRSANAIKNRWCWLAKHGGRRPEPAHEPLAAGSPREPSADEKGAADMHCDSWALDCTEIAWGE
jgi:hypothetical protein